jgi:hypothetical protein
MSFAELAEASPIKQADSTAIAFNFISISDIATSPQATATKGKYRHGNDNPGCR